MYEASKYVVVPAATEAAAKAVVAWGLRDQKVKMKNLAS